MYANINKINYSKKSKLWMPRNCEDFWVVANLVPYIWAWFIHDVLQIFLMIQTK